MRPPRSFDPWPNRGLTPRDILDLLEITVAGTLRTARGTEYDLCAHETTWCLNDVLAHLADVEALG